MEKIKVALIGTGSICRGAHMPAYAKRDDVEIIACADIDFEKAKKFADDFNIPAAFNSVEDLLRNCKPDYVDVCTWPAAHAPVAIAAANAGVHVLCEKPVCHNLEDALALKEAVERNGVNFELAVPLRYQKSAVHARKLVDEGVLGDVFYGKTAYVRERGIPGGWFSCSKYSGGGPIIDIGVHRIDLAWYLMGCPKPVSVSATASYRIGDYRSKEELKAATEVSENNAWAGARVDDYVFDVEDSASGIFRFENGAQLIFETSWSFNGPSNNMTQIAGEKAGITLEPFRIYKAEEDKLVHEDISGDFGCDFFYEEIDHFIDCIRNNKKPSSNIDQAVQLQAMLMGIYESTKVGHEIKLNY